MKKIICYLSVILSVIMLLQPTNAFTAINDTDDEFVNQLSVHSEEFPNAYIQSTTLLKKDLDVKQIQNGKYSISGKSTESQKILNKLYSSEKARSVLEEKADSLVGIVSATAYVSETIKTIDGNPTITDSHLMDKDEVLTSLYSPLNMTRAVDIKTDENHKYKLDIALVCSTVTQTKTSSKYLVTGVAQWSKPSTLRIPSQNPASGEDFFGFSWAGKFTSTNQKATITYTPKTTNNPIRLADAEPNKALVWSFDEYFNLGDMYLYANLVEIETTIYKNKLQGGGNDANLVLKYIHTYQNLSGNVNISFGTGGTSGGFSISPVSMQWSIVCLIGGLKY